MRISRRTAAVGVISLIAVVPPVAMSASGSPAPPKVLVSQASSDPLVPSGEAWVVRNPRNPKQIAAAWPATTDRSQGLNTPNHAYCGVGVSYDGGRTWTRKHVVMNTNNYGVQIPTVSAAGYNLFPTAPCGDSMIGVGPTGVLTMIGAVVGSPSFLQTIISTDWGRTWSRPYEAFGAQQSAAGSLGTLSGSTPSVTSLQPSLGPGRPWMAVDPITGQVAADNGSDGSGDGRYLSVSDDHGKTWSPPMRMAPLPLVSPITMAHGIGGATYGENAASPVASAPHPRICPQGGSCSVFETTSDKGKTWVRRPMPPAAGAGGGIPAADPSTPGRYAVLIGGQSLSGTLSGSNGPTLNVWVTKNSGRTWKLTKTVRPNTGDTLIKTWIAYSPTGALGVYWRAQHSDGSSDVVVVPGTRTTDVAVIVARDGVGNFSDPVYLVRNAKPSTTAVAADDCACFLYLDKNNVNATWADSRSSTGQRETWFGTFDYTKLRPARR